MYIVMDHIEGEYPEFDTLTEAKKYILDNYTLPDEGIHPDIDDMRIVKVDCEVKIIKDEAVLDKEIYFLEFKKLNN